MRGLIVAGLLMLTAQLRAGEPTADRIAAVKEATAETETASQSDLKSAKDYAKRIKTAVIIPKSDQASLPNGRPIFRNAKERDEAAAEAAARIALHESRLEAIDKGHVVFPLIRPGIKVGSYGRLPAGWVRVMRVESETRSIVRIEWKNHDWETVILDGLSTKNWADDQVLDSIPGAYECDSVRRDGGSSTLVLTPIDPAPYEAALRRK